MMNCPDGLTLRSLEVTARVLDAKIDNKIRARLMGGSDFTSQEFNAESNCAPREMASTIHGFSGK
jgi:hypothetical protein